MHQGVVINLTFLPGSEEDTSGLADVFSPKLRKWISAELRVWDNALFCPIHPGVAIDPKFLLSSEEETSGLADIISP